MFWDVDFRGFIMIFRFNFGSRSLRAYFKGNIPHPIAVGRFGPSVHDLMPLVLLVVIRRMMRIKRTGKRNIIEFGKILM